jgi:methylphosphotriester-DNA--protein-cysteine methyltransferase
MASFFMMPYNRMIPHSKISDHELRQRIRQHEISFGGNAKLKIYGKLNCRSGKKMKRQNRVFFHSEAEAIRQGFRPCGHCLPSDYKKWKDGFIQH